MKYEIDFLKEFELLSNGTAMLNKLTSPKGIRREHPYKHGAYMYTLHTDLVQVYKGEPAQVDPGLYWLCNICTPYEDMQWSQYLFVVDPDGAVYPVAEYINCVDSYWIKEALPIIKAYFLGEKLDPCEITVYQKKKAPKGHWHL